MPCGIIASHFLLEATVRHHLVQQNTPLATQAAENIYIDNLILGMNSASDAKAAYQEVKSIFNKASMNLREWSTNCAEFQSTIPTALLYHISVWSVPAANSQIFISDFHLASSALCRPKHFDANLSLRCCIGGNFHIVFDSGWACFRLNRRSDCTLSGRDN